MGGDSYIRFVAALVFVLALIGLFGFLLRRFGPNAGLPVQRRGAARRLGVVEVLPLDARRRLVLVKRDGVEHLLLLGMGDDRVVETGISPPVIADAPAPAPAPSFLSLLKRSQGDKP
ncbi:MULTISPECIES: flagellar biosynthetic protein FliO [Azospirillaceae]|uniref:FliO/MopB family protein n=1 Tax=Azospirillaceae TaxID=2829815 RepID=UPI000B6A7AC3|nr:MULTISPECIES: flagellar biosynthetic protein FliO [Azospirillaceae]MDG5496441.1 flagellar biosynthetic protein FliO [Niveispirillum sp. BGYR6]SNS95986.1 flagellar protein FliO/FliZ [Azospirillum sp. RU38E]SNT12300.1 flagellar protein FliO/FliZ [Azospirillum sp. RU37A]